MSGFCRLLPSTVTGPRLLKLAIVSSPAFTPPTVKDSLQRAGGSVTVEHPEPELPAATTVTIPAARCAAVAAWSVPALQPSAGGHPQELVVTSGAFVGSPCAGVPPTGYGARKNSKHSMYVAGVPFP